MFLAYEDHQKPKHLVEYLEFRRLIEERIRRGDRRRPIEIYEELIRFAGIMEPGKE